MSFIARLRNNIPTLLIVLAVILGVFFGVFFQELASDIQFIGDIFFRLIQMSIIPFVMGQIIEAVGSLTKQQLNRSGLSAIILFFVSSVIASAFGIAMCYIFRPGVNFGELAGDATSLETVNTDVATMLTQFVPTNIVSSMAEGSIIQVILFSLFFGVAISAYVTKVGHSYALELIKETNVLIMSVIRTVMKAAPIGIFAYVASTASELGMQSLHSLLSYMGIFGISIFLFLLIWIGVIWITCGANPMKLMRKMLPMSIMAMATTSSAVTLPLEMKDAKEKIGLDEDIANLVLPLGMPLNSNGAAMYISFTAIMIAQIYGISFDLPYLGYIAVVSMLLSLANAVVPGAGIVSLTMMAPQFGLPLESIAIFAGIDWIMGVFRTVLNVNSDVFCALLVARFEGKLDRKTLNA
ncbi:MAG: dicarboxylate/amino acid:cation symporter [Atopobiaceae bacterium]|jgi:proton glutamate symport protein